MKGFGFRIPDDNQYIYAFINQIKLLCNIYFERYTNKNTLRSDQGYVIRDIISFINVCSFIFCE